MKTTKYNYLKIIQQNYGHGWEDVSEYQTDSVGRPTEFVTEKYASGQYRPNKQRSLLNHDLKEYRLTGYSTRVIRRKELKK